MVAEYKYDAWGKCKVETNSGGIAEINPFRYRSYYYDNETGLYYLNSRYYDPEVGRFLSADTVYYLDPESINGLNLYAYCLNNPVMMTDSAGHFPFLIALILGIGLVIGAVVGGKVAYDNAVSAGKTGSDLFWSTVGGIFMGAGVGLAIAGVSLMFVGIGFGFAAGSSALLFGATAAQTFAWGGALAFNFMAFVIAPLIGIDMEGIEFGPNQTLPNPEKHQDILRKEHQTFCLLALVNKKRNLLN